MTIFGKRLEDMGRFTGRVVMPDQEPRTLHVGTVGSVAVGKPSDLRDETSEAPDDDDAPRIA